MQDDFPYTQEQKRVILDGLKRNDVALVNTTKDQFIADTAGAVRVALAFRETLKKRGDSWRNDEKRIRKMFRKEVLDPLKQALDGFRNLGTEDQMWVGPGFPGNNTSIPHPWQGDLEAMSEELAPGVQPTRGHPSNVPLQVLVSVLADLWIQCTGRKPTCKQDPINGASSPFLDYCRAAIGPTGLAGDAIPENQLVHHVRQELKGRNLFDEEQDHPTES